MKAKEKYEKLEEQYLSFYKLDNVKEKEVKYRLYLKGIRQLAYRNYADAQYVLAEHYDASSICGDPNPYYNPKKMFYWHTKAAANNHGGSYNVLAIMYEKGEGCKKDMKKAYEYYKKSASLGDYVGKMNLRIFRRQLKQGKIFLDDE